MAAEGGGEPVKLDYLVTGTGRCGTVYMARLLTSLGIMCGHEAVFDLDGPDIARTRLASGEFKTSWVSSVDVLSNTARDGWFEAGRTRAESSYMAAPFIDGGLLAGTAIIHAVREPLQVISSFVYDIGFFDDGRNYYSMYRDFVLTHIDDVMRLPTPIERTVQHWMLWNEMIERKAAGHRYLRFQIETEVGASLLDFLGVSAQALERVHRDRATNSWKRRANDLSLADIPSGDLRDRFVAMAARYGYRL